MSCWPKQLGGQDRHGHQGMGYPRWFNRRPGPIPPRAPFDAILWANLGCALCCPSSYDSGNPCGILPMRTRNLRYILGWSMLSSDLGHIWWPLKTSQHKCLCGYGYCSWFIDVRALADGSTRIMGLVHPSCWCCCWKSERQQNAENHLDKNEKDTSHSQATGPSSGMLLWFFALRAFFDT